MLPVLWLTGPAHPPDPAWRNIYAYRFDRVLFNRELGALFD